MGQMTFKVTRNDSSTGYIIRSKFQYP